MKTTNEDNQAGQETDWEGLFARDASYLIRRSFCKGEGIGETIKKVREWFLQHGRGHCSAFGQIGEFAKSIAAEMGIEWAFEDRDDSACTDIEADKEAA